jgi:hypothetical protein
MVFHRINKYSLVLYTYLALCFIFLYTIGIDAIEGRIDFEFFADSETYLDFVKYDYSYSQIIREFFNMIGPTLVLNLVNSNFYLVFLINSVIILYFYYTLVNVYSINRKYLIFWLLISPVFFSSIISINKEIFIFLTITLMLKYRFSNKNFYFVLAIFASLLVRWQMSLFVIVNFFILSDIKFFRSHLRKTILMFLIVYSALAYFNFDKFERINLHVLEGSVASKSGILNMLNSIQSQYFFGYIIVFIPKLFFLLFGNVIKNDHLFELKDFYSTTIIPIQSFLNLILFSYIFIFQKYLNKNLHYIIYSAIIYGIIFTISPIFSIRYLFPIYVYLIIILSITPNSIKRSGE